VKSSKYVAIDFSPHREVFDMRTLFTAALTVMTLPTMPVFAQQDFVARDGDRVIVEDDARVRIVRRRQATVRTIFLEPHHQLIVLVDYGKPGEFPDGRPDAAMQYSQVEGEWPLGPRWEGFTTLLEYTTASPPFPRALGLMTPHGLVQLLPNAAAAEHPMKDPAARVLTFRGSSGGGANALNFDEAERQQLAVAAKNRSLQLKSGGSVSVTASINGVADPGSTSWSATQENSQTVVGPLRVGGNIRPPKKIRDAVPNYPDAARQAKVVGTVVLEITVGTDGSVTNPRVVRGIPLLNDAAIEAVLQWNYEPTVVNGRPVPVIMTVVVSFAPEQ
jgi:TonB family protein